MKVNYIDTSTVEGKITVMRAHANGARVACCGKADAAWRACKPKWNWDMHDYAVIAEPREVWVEFDPEGDRVGAYTVKPLCLAKGHTCVRFVEAY